jgi:hypothetical protein
VGVVALPTGARFVVVDRTGQQLELVAERADHFLPVSGVEASGVPGQPVDEVGRSVVTLADGLSPAVAGASSTIVVVDGLLALDLTVGGRAVIGDVRDLDAKLLALETVLQRVDLTCVEVIDVRVPSAPTVRRTTVAGAEEEPGAEAGGC